MDKIPISSQLHESFKLIKRSTGDVPQIRFDFITLAVEDIPKDTGNAMHEMKLQAFREAQEKYQMDTLVHLQFHSRIADKIERIAALQPSIANGWLAFNETLPEVFMRQMRQFPTGDFCDGPDALHGATQLPILQFPVERHPDGMPIDDDPDDPNAPPHVIRSYL